MKYILAVGALVILLVDLLTVFVFHNQPDIQVVLIFALAAGCAYLAMDDTSQSDI